MEIVKWKAIQATAGHPYCSVLSGHRLLLPLLIKYYVRNLLYA